MPLNRSTAVIGSAIFAPFNDRDRSLEEVLYDVTQAALQQAGITIDDIDGIVVASNDQYDGRAIAIMQASGPVGGVDRDILSTPSAGEHAMVLGVLRIASALYETQLVVAWGSTEAASLSEVQRLGTDPYYHRALPLDELSAFALQAAAVGSAMPGAHQLAASIAAGNRRNGAIAYPGAGGALDADEIAASRPLRWPLREGMIATPVAGAVAIVLASEDFVQKRNIARPAWVRGMGWATETGFLGDRDLAKADALRAAAAYAYEEAAVGDPRNAFDLVELTDASPYQELIAREALGLASPLERTSEQAGPEPATLINPSGGVTTINPVFCTGLIRIAEAANQVRGTAGLHQVERARTALAHAASGFAMMYQTVVVLGSERSGVSP